VAIRDFGKKNDGRRWEKGDLNEDEERKNPKKESERCEIEGMNTHFVDVQGIHLHRRALDD